MNKTTPSSSESNIIFDEEKINFPGLVRELLNQSCQLNPFIYEIQHIDDIIQQIINQKFTFPTNLNQTDNTDKKFQNQFKTTFHHFLSKIHQHFSIFDHTFIQINPYKQEHCITTPKFQEYSFKSPTIENQLHTVTPATPLSSALSEMPSREPELIEDLFDEHHISESNSLFEITPSKKVYNFLQSNLISSIPFQLIEDLLHFSQKFPCQNPSSIIHSSSSNSVQDESTLNSLFLKVNNYNKESEIELKPFHNPHLETIRIRLGDNVKVICSSISCLGSCYLLLDDLSLYKVSNEKSQKLDVKISSKNSLIAGNENCLYCIEPTRIISINPDNNSQEILNYISPQNETLVAAYLSPQNDFILYLLYKDEKKQIYSIDTLFKSFEFRVRLGTFSLEETPICITVNDSRILIATKSLIYQFEYDINNTRIDQTFSLLPNYNQSSSLYSMSSDYYLLIRNCRSYLQLTFLRQRSFYCFLSSLTIPEVSLSTSTVKGMISSLLISKAKFLMVLLRNCIFNNPIPCFPEFLSFNLSSITSLINLSQIVISSSVLDHPTIALVMFVVFSSLFLIHSTNSMLILPQKETIRDLLIKYCQIQTNAVGKPFCMMTILLFLGSAYTLFSPSDMIKIHTFLTSNSENRENYVLLLPLLIDKLPIIYMVDSTDLELLIKLTSPFTCYGVIRSIIITFIQNFKMESPKIDEASLFTSFSTAIHSLTSNFPISYSLLLFIIVLHRLIDHKIITLLPQFINLITYAIPSFENVLDKSKLEQLDRSVNNENQFKNYLDQVEKNISSVVEHQDTKLIQNNPESSHLKKIENLSDVFQIIETPHPLGNGSKYNWEVQIPGAEQIEIEFDPKCAFVLDDQDTFQIFDGLKSTSKVVYERNLQSDPTFPKTLTIQGSSTRIVLKCFEGYQLYGLKMLIHKKQFQSNNNISNRPLSFLSRYFFHCLGSSFEILFHPFLFQPKMQCCTCLLHLPHLDSIKDDKISISEQIMNKIYNNIRSPTRIKPTPISSKIEATVVAAILHQLSLSEYSLLEETETVEKSNFPKTRRENVLLKKAISNKPSNFSSTLQKPLMSLGIHENSPVIKNKKITRPILIKPSLENSQFRRSYIVSKTEVQFGKGGVEGFLSVLYKIIIQIRNKIRFLEQKASKSDEEKLIFNTYTKNVLEKCQYFYTSSPTFSANSLIDNKSELIIQHANQIARIISSDISYDEINQYVTQHWEMMHSQKLMMEHLNSISMNIKAIDAEIELWIPILLSLNNHIDCKNTIDIIPSLYHLIVAVSQRFSNSIFDIISIESDFDFITKNKNPGNLNNYNFFDHILSALNSNYKIVAMEIILQISYLTIDDQANNEIYQNFLDKVNSFLTIQSFKPEFILEALTLINNKKFKPNCILINQCMENPTPQIVRIVLQYLAFIFSKSNIDDDFHIKIRHKTYNASQFINFLIWCVGERSKTGKIPFYDNEIADICHAKTANDISLFFHIIIQENSSFRDNLLIYFDDILLSLKTISDCSSSTFSQAIGLFAILGEGINSFDQASFVFYSKDSNIYKILHKNNSKITLQNSLSINKNCKRRNTLPWFIFPPSPTDFPATHFRIEIFHLILDYSLNEQRSLDFDILFANFVLFLSIFLQNETNCKEFINNISDSVLLKLSIQSTKEIMPYGISSLIDEAANFFINRFQHTREKIDSSIMVKEGQKKFYMLNDFVSTFDCENFIRGSYSCQFEICNIDRKGIQMVGLITDQSSLNFHSFIALDLRKRKIILNGIWIRDIVFDNIITKGSKICFEASNDQVNFFINDKRIGVLPFPSNISQASLSPLVISKKEKGKANLLINFSEIQNGTILKEPILTSFKPTTKNETSFSTNDLSSKSYFQTITQHYNQNNNVNHTNQLCEKKTYSNYSFNSNFDNGPLRLDWGKIEQRSSIEIFDLLKNTYGQPFEFKFPGKFPSNTCRYIGTGSKDGYFLVNVIDPKSGKILVKEVKQEDLQPLNYNYFPPVPNSQIFRTIAIRVIRLLTIRYFHDKIFKFNKNEIDFNPLFSQYLSLMFAELPSHFYKIYFDEPSCDNSFLHYSKNSKPQYIPIISNEYHIMFLNVFKKIIFNNIKSLIKFSMNYFRKDVFTSIAENSISINEVGLRIETRHPLAYTRINRTIETHEAYAFIPYPDPQFSLPQRGLFLDPKLLLIRNASELNRVINSSIISLDIEANSISTEWGASLTFLPIYTFSTDPKYQPISFVLCLLRNLFRYIACLSNTISDSDSQNDKDLYHKIKKALKKYAIPVIFYHKNNSIFKIIWYNLLEPLIFSPIGLPSLNSWHVFQEWIDNGMANEMGIIPVENINKFMISLQDFKIIIIQIAAKLRTHSKYVHKFLKEFNPSALSIEISPESIKAAEQLSELKNMYNAGRDFFDNDSISILYYFFDFSKIPSLNPYNVFFRFFKEINTGPIMIDSKEQKSSYAFNSDYKVQVLEGTKFGVLHFYFGNSFSNYIEVTSPCSFHLLRSESEGFLLKYTPPPNSEGEYHIKLTPMIFVKNDLQQNNGQSIYEFLKNIQTGKENWKPEFDTILAKYVFKDLISNQNLLSYTDSIPFIGIPTTAIYIRFFILRAINNLFYSNDSTFSQFFLLVLSDVLLSKHDYYEPLHSLVISGANSFSSIKFFCLENLVSSNFEQKKTFSFNRSRALLARSNPSSGMGSSLLSQVMEQISISNLSCLKCKDAPWHVILEGEGAADAGGPGRDLFSDVCSEFCLPLNHIFIPTPRAIKEGTNGEFIPDPRAPENILDSYVYVGAFIALAFTTKIQQPFHFPKFVWNYLLGKSVTLNDIMEIDPDFKNEIISIENLQKDNEEEQMVEINSISGSKVKLRMKGNYKELFVQFRVNEMNLMLDKMKEGFSIIMGKINGKMFTGEELEKLICGEDNIPIESLKRLIKVRSSKSNDFDDLMKVLSEFTPEERMLFIKFVTGKMSIPVSGTSWNGQINVSFVSLENEKPPYPLPVSATCSSSIEIPRYPSLQILAEKLRTAITFGQDIVLDHAFDAGGIIQ